MYMIFYYVVVAIVGIALSPLITALIKRYSLEEKIFTKDFMKDVHFDWKIALSLPIAFILLLYFKGWGITFVIDCFVATLLVISFAVDMKSQIIPNETNFIGFLVGIILVYWDLTQNPLLGIDRLLGMVVGAGIFLLIALFSLLVYRKMGMGMGDVKLMGMLGLFFGTYDIIQVFVFSFFIGAIISLFLLATKIKKSDDYIPFGPFIVMAAFITMIIPATTTIQWALTHFVT